MSFLLTKMTTINHLIFTLHKSLQSCIRSLFLIQIQNIFCWIFAFINGGKVFSILKCNVDFSGFWMTYWFVTSDHCNLCVSYLFLPLILDLAADWSKYRLLAFNSWQPLNVYIRCYCMICMIRLVNKHLYLLL